MLRSQSGLRLLSANDLPEVLELLASDPVQNVFVEYRARLTKLEPRWLGGEIWGWFRGDRLTSICHAAANLVPVLGDEEALLGYAARAVRKGRSCSTIVGPQDQVAVLWGALESRWDAPRELRLTQPHLEISRPPLVAPDPLVRRSGRADVEALYPACVAMYTEEVGISPEWDGGRDLYRARVAQLVDRGWSFARYDEGRVVFKAEIACATPYACQVQGVYVPPDRRGQGLAAAGMAAVVEIARREIAPVVSLYVNEHNAAARAAYSNVGFAQTATFSTVMF